MNNDTTTSATGAVTLKLPEFWTSQPQAWFHTVEAQFALRGIVADETKYFYVVSVLGSETAATVEGLLNNPPSSDKYSSLKSELLNVFALSDRQKKNLLMTLDGLGDRKPTELLRYMKTLHSTDKGDLFFMAFFMRQLPTQVRTILAVRDFSDVDQMAKAADDVLIEQNLRPATTMIQVSHPRAKQPGNAKPPARSSLCYYHLRFGTRAKNCRQPCSWPGNAEASN